MARFSPAQYETAADIARLLIESGNMTHSATDLLAAATGQSAIIDKRLQNALQSIEGRNLVPETSAALGDLLREFYAGSADDNEDRTQVVRLRLTPTEAAQIRERAEADGLTLSAYIRKRCGL